MTKPIRKAFLSTVLFAPILFLTQACDPAPREAELKAKVDTFIQKK